MEQRPALILFEIYGQRALVAMQILLIRPTPAAGDRIALSIFAGRRLDFNDFGTPIRQQSNRHRPCSGDGQIQHTDMG
jgi:hypothetical protein